jgi:multisubunit Na+/H+ antiporter MnhC subunit
LTEHWLNQVELDQLEEPVSGRRKIVLAEIVLAEHQHRNLAAGWTPTGLISIKASADKSASMGTGKQQQEQVMPAGDMLFLTAFIIAFGVFALVLGWADQRTRHPHR